MSDARISGDSTRLWMLAAAIKQIGSDEFRQSLLEQIGDYALDRIREEFLVGRDPYGNPWEPLKRPRMGFGGPLLKTGRLQNGMRKRVSKKMVKIYNNRPYAPFHQNGTKSIPARPMLPDRLPDEWRAEFERMADEAIRRALSGVL